ncbi:MAG: diaminopimelate epimerase [Bacteroidetes bacterium]|nr:diaminopimelate epimerase [Bacteroidota bacterium]
MRIKFSKYEGTGNDFIIIDDWKKNFPLRKRALIRNLCDRRFGIGADGLILLRKHKGFDFSMVYFNSDGRESTMCGNGARCITLFARKNGVIKNKTHFLAVDGAHDSEILSMHRNSAMVKLAMNEVNPVKRKGKDFIMDTGSPHYVRVVKDLIDLDVIKESRKIRYSAKFRRNGINVNFVMVKAGKVMLRTYERGVENETLSCGTGVVASALACSVGGYAPVNGTVNVITPGGQLKVKYQKSTTSANGFTKIFLIGPARFVFEGTLIF